MIRALSMVSRVASRKVHMPAVRCISISNKQSWAYNQLVELGKLPALPESEKGEPIVIDDEALANPSQKVKDLADTILKLNMLENAAVFNYIEQDLLSIDPQGFFFGVDDGSVPVGGAGAAAAAPVEEKKEEKTSFDIKLAAVNAAAKIKVIKEVRAITGLGLKEAKELVEKAPVTIKEGLKKEEAEGFLKLLKEAGAEVQLV